MNLNVGNNPPPVGLQIQPGIEPGVQPETPKINYSSRAGRVKRTVMDSPGMVKLKDRGVRRDDVISGRSIKTLLKKSAGEMAARRWTNFLSFLPGNLGRTSWSGSSHLRDIQNLAETYRNIPQDQLQLRLDTLNQLKDELGRYGDGSTQERLRDRLTALRSFVRAEIIEIRTRQTEPGLLDLRQDLKGPGGLIHQGSDAFAAALLNNNLNVLPQWAEGLGEALGNSLLEDGAAPEKFEGSSGRILKEEILKLLTDFHPEVRQLCPDYDTAPPEVKEALDGLYIRLVNQLNGSTGKNTAPGTMEFGGVVYTSVGGVEKKEVPVKEGGSLMGVGGYAKVYLFEDGEGHEVVVKDALVQQQQQRDDAPMETQYEARMHELAFGEGHENLVAMKGSFFNGIGTSICLEKCSGGKLDEFKGKLAGALSGPEALSNLSLEQQAKLRDLVLATLVRDMARGLSHMHHNGVSHLDFKGANVFLSWDGKAKIGDFGTAMRFENGVGQLPFDHTIPDAPYYLSPEALNAKDEMSRVAGKVKVGIYNIPDVNLEQEELRLVALNEPSILVEFRAVKDQLQDIQNKLAEGGLTTQQRRDLANEWSRILGPLNLALEMFQEEPGRDFGVTLKAPSSDVWALGMTLSEMNYYPGTEAGSPFIREQSYEVGEAIQEFGHLDPPKTYTEYRTERWRLENGGGEPPRNGPLDLLLDRMLHPDPDQRLTSEQVLQDPFLTQNGVGDDKVREFIRLLNDPNTTREQLEVAALAAVLV